MLTDRELAQMRADVAALLPDTCSILTYSGTADGEGGVELTASGTVTASCRLDFPDYGKEQQSAGAIQPFKNGVLSLPYNTAITTANKVLVNSVTYNVTAVNTGQSWEAVRRATVERVP